MAQIIQSRPEHRGVVHAAPPLQDPLDVLHRPVDHLLLPVLVHRRQDELEPRLGIVREHRPDERLDHFVRGDHLENRWYFTMSMCHMMTQGTRMLTEVEDRERQVNSLEREQMGPGMDVWHMP